MKQVNNIDERSRYYDQLVKKIVVYGAAAFFSIGTLISLVWIDV